MARIWIQDWGTYGEQTLICVGANKKEIVAHLKKTCPKSQFLYCISKFFEIPKGCDGCFWTHYNPKYRGSILWLKKLEYTPESISVLSHEVCHAIRRLLIEERNMHNEVEAQCYQTEFLIKNILLKGI